jgi:hypothetical protein
LSRYKSNSKDSQIISFTIPFDLEKPEPALEDLITSSGAPISLSTVFTKVSPEAVEGLRWALKGGHSVDIDVQATLSDSLLEGFEDLMAKATADLETVPPIVLCTFLLSLSRNQILISKYSEHSAASP